MSHPADRNLLFGTLALQLDFITRDQLVAALQTGKRANAQPFGQILEEGGALSPYHRRLLEPLVDAHVAAHDNDVALSLAAQSAVDSRRLRLDTDCLDDPDIGAGCSQIPATIFSTPGTRTSRLASTTGGRFRILKAHAKGGLGEVFLAKDLELGRDVALKEIQPQFADQPDCRSRFVFEAEVTGGLEHPGIVPVYSLGNYDDGRPFYAMRFIRGDSLDDAIKSFHNSASVEASARRGTPEGEHIGLATRRSPKFESLEFRQLLGRFIAVCEAVAYAHSRGVVHRDLKPGNVMLGKYGETLVVDWGLAKSLADRKCEPPAHSGETTFHSASGSASAPTIHGHVMGTPAYMSPEQASGAVDQIDTSSDVYSLGATLFEILTGRKPLSGEMMDVIDRVIRGDVPTPRSVDSMVPAALDAVCRKAMAMNPTDRYGSAKELAADLEQWLADEPVRAWSEPLSTRARRWMKKHRTLVTTSAAALVLIAVGLGALAWQRESARRDIAKEHERADEEKQTAQAVLEFVENKVFAAARPENHEGGLGHTVTLRKAVESALPFVANSFTERPLIEARLRKTLGASFWYLGDASIAAEQFQVARTLYTRHRGHDHLDTLRAMNNLASSYFALGRHNDALELRSEAMAVMVEKLGAGHPDTLETMNNLAASFAALGRLAEALKLREQALSLMTSNLGADHPNTLQGMMVLANSYADVGRHADAIKLHEATLSRRKVMFGLNDLDTLASMNNLANSYSALGQSADALKLREEALPMMTAKLGHDHPDTLSSTMCVAISYYELGRHSEALKLFEETLARQKIKLGHDHPSTWISMNNLASCYFSLGRHAEAFKLFEETLAQQTNKLGLNHPDTMASMNNLANSHASLGRQTEALKLHEKTLALRRANLGPDHPGTLQSMGNLANSYQASGRQTEALKLQEEILNAKKAKKP